MENVFSLGALTVFLVCLRNESSEEAVFKEGNKISFCHHHSVQVGFNEASDYLLTSEHFVL